MRTVQGIVAICLLFPLIHCQGGNPGLIEGRGRIQYIDLEGGFYGIVAADGKKYDPVNMPTMFRAEGLEVEFTGKVVDQAGTHMWGAPIELIDIRKIEDIGEEEPDPGVGNTP